MTLKGGCAYHFAPEFADLNRSTADIDVHSYDVIAHDEVMSLFRRAIQIEDNNGVVFELGAQKSSNMNTVSTRACVPDCPRAFDDERPWLAHCRCR
jgi:hypothetical protein